MQDFPLTTLFRLRVDFVALCVRHSYDELSTHTPHLDDQDGNWIGGHYLRRIAASAMFSMPNRRLRLPH